MTVNEYGYDIRKSAADGGAAETRPAVARVPGSTLWFPYVIQVTGSILGDPDVYLIRESDVVDTNVGDSTGVRANPRADWPHAIYENSTGEVFVVWEYNGKIYIRTFSPIAAPAADASIDRFVDCMSIDDGGTAGSPGRGVTLEVGVLPAPTNLTGIDFDNTANTFKLSWDTYSAAYLSIFSYYKIYRDGVVIGTSPTNSFTTTIFFGSEYRVTGVTIFGSESAFSNVYIPVQDLHNQQYFLFDDSRSYLTLTNFSNIFQGILDSGGILDDGAVYREGQTVLTLQTNLFRRTDETYSLIDDGRSAIALGGVQTIIYT